MCSLLPEHPHPRFRSATGRISECDERVMYLSSLNSLICDWFLQEDKLHLPAKKNKKLHMSLTLSNSTPSFTTPGKLVEYSLNIQLFQRNIWSTTLECQITLDGLACERGEIHNIVKIVAAQKAERRWLHYKPNHLKPELQKLSWDKLELTSKHLQILRSYQHRYLEPLPKEN